MFVCSGCVKTRTTSPKLSGQHQELKGQIHSEVGRKRLLNVKRQKKILINNDRHKTNKIKRFRSQIKVDIWKNSKLL